MTALLFVMMALCFDVTALCLVPADFWRRSSAVQVSGLRHLTAMPSDTIIQRRWNVNMETRHKAKPK
jgi:hypothetical protein